MEPAAAAAVEAAKILAAARGLDAGGGGGGDGGWDGGGGAGASATAAPRVPHEDAAALARRVAGYRASIAAVMGALAARGDADAASIGPFAPGARGGGGGGGEPAGTTAGAGAPAGGAPLPARAASPSDAADGDADASAGGRAIAQAPPAAWRVPPHCVPIQADVTAFDWAGLAASAQFDAVMMDPPWQLATSNPTRGVALGYSQLSDDAVAALPVPELQRRGGLLFVWVINAKFKFTLDLFDRWGYE
jgi:hypothetical protein